MVVCVLAFEVDAWRRLEMVGLKRWSDTSGAWGGTSNILAWSFFFLEFFILCLAFGHPHHVDTTMFPLCRLNQTA